ncbi:hypothetical protein FS815_25550 [Agrobacterium vitis]|uniref:hypothetical protein n=1 Tax=Allorhizobium ampelinum TaxID=3025782 RepID=UPI001F404A6D|nr:hypothetical protein [Allorhizobium ampelinum]MCF1450159.1 hypothetical protein [Allorhizobium ampelinum]
MTSLTPGVISFALGAAWQSWRASSSEAAAQINDLLKDVRELETLATEYWTQIGSNKPEMKALEVKIRGMTFVIASFEEQAGKLFPKYKRNYEKSVDALFRASTGGQFETKGRKADYARAISVKEAAADLISVARKARHQSAGFSAVWWFIRQKAIWIGLLVSYPYRWILARRMRPMFDAESNDD